MPQTPPQPPVPPKPPEAPDPAIALPDISLPGAGLPGVGLPSTTQMLEGLRERRDILREQLQMAGNRRSSLVGQLNQDGDNSLPREAREGIQRRIDLIDERILQLERDQALTEQLISNAPPEILAASEAETRFQQQTYNGGNIDEGEAAGIGFATFGVGIVLTLLVSRFRRGWRAKRGGAMAAAVQTREDPRIDRLTQTVEAIAEEVERIGEGQRFVTQLLANRPGAGALQAEALAAEGQHR